MSFRKHICEDGRTVYYWRAKVPVKKTGGEIVWRRVERSTGVGTLAEAREVARRLEAEYHERAGRPVSQTGDLTFADAALSYMKNGGERTYLAPILELIGSHPLTDIGQTLIQDVADRLKPGTKPATQNRHIFTPVLAVLNFAAKTKMAPPPALLRPRGHDKAPTLDLPDAEWFNRIMPELSPQMRALVLLITCHGLRIAEAIERTPADLDPNGWRLGIPDTKAGVPVLVKLSEPVIEAIKAIPDWRKQRWLFGTRHRSNIARAISKAAKRAGLRTYGTHAIGRHSFSVRVLKAGKSLKFLMSAGRWASPKMPMVRYGHLEISEVGDAVNEIAADWTQPEARVARLKKV
jgi:integrase